MEPKPELTPEEGIEAAIKEVQDAMIANIRAKKTLINLEKEKEATRFTLLKAKERLTALERMYME